MSENPENKKKMLKDGRYEILKPIGSGGQGQIFQVRDTRNNTIKAIKVEKNCEKEIRKEVNILQELAGKNDERLRYLIKYMDSFDNNLNFCVVFEYHMYGDLSQLIEKKIRKNSLFPDIMVLFWSYQLLDALNFIHTNRIIHRDIKPSNILIKNYSNLVLCDFGMAVHTKSITNNNKGSLNYTSPEILNDEPYDSKIDIWSFGCVVYELVKLKKAVPGTSISEICHNCIQTDLAGNVFNQPKIDYLIKSSIRIDPKNRKTAGEMLQEIRNDIPKEKNFRFQAERFYFDGEIALENHEYTKALEYLKQSFHLLKYESEFFMFKSTRELKTQSEKIILANTLDKIGQCHLAHIRHDKALKYLTKAYEMRTDFVDYDHHIIYSLINLGDCHLSIRDYQKALDYFRNAQSTIESMQRKKAEKRTDLDVELAKSLGRIGKCFFLSDKDKESLDYNLKSLEMFEKIYKNKDNEELARAYNQVGNNYIYQKKTQEGKELLEKAYSMRKRLFGARTHPDMAQSKFDIANVHFNLGNYERALDLQMKAYDIYKNFYGDDAHPKIQNCLICIGNLKFKLKNFKEALDFYKQSYEMCKKLYGKKDSATQMSLKNICLALKSLGDDKTLQKYQKLLEN